jgi:hypothetical protein
VVNVSDLENQPEDGETKAEQEPRKGPTITIKGDPKALRPNDGHRDEGGDRGRDAHR